VTGTVPRTRNVAGGQEETSLTAGDVARLVGGRLEGDATRVVRAVAPLDRASSEDVTFLAAARYAPLLERSSPGLVLVTAELESAAAGAAARVVVEKPHEALLALLPLLYRPAPRVPGIHPTAVIGRGARIGDDVTIDAYAVIGDRATVGARAWIGSHCALGAATMVGEDSRLHPHVTLYEGAVVGRRVALHSGVRIASDGFGYVYRDNRHEKIPHVGRCVIEDDVEIGANTTLDRGSVDDTVVGAGTKIDNLVHIGHNVRIGRLCLLMAQVGISGSAHIEDGCILAGQAGIGGHLTIGKGARIGGQAGVFGDVPAGQTWSGYPARPHREALRAQAALFKLPSLLRGLERLLGERES